jgi:HEAT repeat protein
MAIGAARLMTKHKPVEARAAIDCAAGAQDWIVRAAALNASQAVMSKKSWTELATSKLDDPELGVRLAAARLLGDDPKAIDVFVAALGDADARLGAAIDLTRLGDDRGLAALGELVAADDPAIRRSAADGYASAHHLDGGIVPALADEDPIVRITAAGAILTLTR